MSMCVCVYAFYLLVPYVNGLGIKRRGVHVMHRWLAEDDDHCQKDDGKSYNKENNKLPALEVNDIMDKSVPGCDYGFVTFIVSLLNVPSLRSGGRVMGGGVGGGVG